MTDPTSSQSSDLEPPSTPAGWYPTPDGRQRYWDGSRWTDLPWSEADAASAAASKNRPTREPRSRKKLLLTVVIVIAVLLIGGGTWAGISAANAAAAHSAAVAKEKAAKVAAAKKAKAKAAAVAAERARRAAQIPAIEASVKAMAIKDVADGVLDGHVLDSTCTAVGGGSTSALDGASTVFECFVGTKKNSDGTETGYDFNATMNWATGEYTYGLGKPN